MRTADGTQSSRSEAPVLKGIVNERVSQLRLVTSVRLRWMAVLGQLAAIAAVTLLYGFPINIGTCLILIAVSAWINVFLSIRYPARHRLSTRFAFGLIVYDLVQLAALLYLTGGIQNPFSVLLVAPVTVAAATLPPRYTIFLGAMLIAAGALLLNHYHPLPWRHGTSFELPFDYKVGSLLAVVATMGFMAFFTWRLNKETRQMSAALAATDLVLASEQRLHALDGLAAAAAHELGTPLSTIALVSKELEYELGSDSRFKEDLQLLHSQARRCREILQKLTLKPDEQDPMHASLSVIEILEEASAPHRAAGKRLIISASPLPGLDDEVRIEPVAHRRPGVIYGLANLIENAVSYAQSEVQLTARWNGSHVFFTITDDGPGFAPEMMDSIGEPYVTSRRYEEKGEQAHSGLGLGLFIAKTLLERSGATVSFGNLTPPRRGANVQISWPRPAFELPPGAFSWPGRRGMPLNAA
jgi:two-component system, sensor histidine kinase RegB